MAVLITGAGSGIGRALAVLLLSKDARVPVIFLVGRREESLLETSSLCTSTSCKTVCIIADVASDDAPRIIAAAVTAAAIRLSSVIHCAGTLGPIAPLSRVSRRDFESVMSTNLTGPVFLTSALLPLMETGSRILHISSGAAQRAIEGWGPYCISKAALNMAYRMFAIELKEQGISVGSARPGVVETAMQEAIRKGDVEIFPDHNRFIDLHKSMETTGATTIPHPPPSTSLDTCENVAYFLAWLLSDKLSAEEFSSIEWDSRDTAHHPRWCII